MADLVCIFVKAAVETQVDAGGSCGLEVRVGAGFDPDVVEGAGAAGVDVPVETHDALGMGSEAGR